MVTFVFNKYHPTELYFTSNTLHDYNGSENSKANDSCIRSLKTVERSLVEISNEHLPKVPVLYIARNAARPY